MEVRIEENVKSVLKRIERAAEQCKRDPADITLVAVSKTAPPEGILRARDGGAKCFGESYVQEMIGKKAALAGEDIDFHFIGHLQRNKVKDVVGSVSLIESVDSVRLAQEISKRSVMCGTLSSVLIEVNVGMEKSKSGVAPDRVEELIDRISDMPGIRVKGLMAIPPFDASSEGKIASFTLMSELFIDMGRKKTDNITMCTLSMGMTGDFETAIKCGSNQIRVGTAIFGPRP